MLKIITIVIVTTIITITLMTRVDLYFKNERSHWIKRQYKQPKP